MQFCKYLSDTESIPRRSGFRSHNCYAATRSLLASLNRHMPAVGLMVSAHVIANHRLNLVSHLLGSKIGSAAALMTSERRDVGPDICWSFFGLMLVERVLLRDYKFAFVVVCSSFASAALSRASAPIRRSTSMFLMRTGSQPPRS